MPRRKWSDIALIFLFIGGTTGLGAASFFQSADHESLAREGRTPDPLPPARTVEDLKKLPARFEAHFNDRLAFRESLLNLHAHIKVNGLGVSSSEKVIVGREGWLFLNEASENSEATNIEPAAQVAAWAASFARRGRWLRRQGIEYLVVLAPEKQSVYAEYVPPAHLPHSPTPARQLAVDDNWNLLDLGPVLSVGRRDRRVYHQTDTHWNHDGAYAGYAAIVERLRQVALVGEPLRRERFRIVPFDGVTGDLGRLLHLPDPPTESVAKLRLSGGRARHLKLDVPLDPRVRLAIGSEPQAWGTGDPSLPRGVMFHDSFSQTLLLPLLAEHFDLLVYAPSDSLDPKLVEQFRPDVVIQQIAERKINRHLPALPPGFDE